MEPRYFPKYIGLALHDRCNFDCLHCYRPANRTFRLSYKDVEAALAEIFEFQKMQGLKALDVYFTGGEPTIWEDKEKVFLDLLLLVATRYCARPYFDTNGSCFTDEKQCFDFFEKYFSNTNNTLRIYLSADCFHFRKEGNGKLVFSGYDKNKNSIPALDNIINYGEKSGNMTKFEVEVSWIMSALAKHDIPDVLRNRYRDYKNIRFTVAPLLPLGRKGDKLGNITPVLKPLNGDGLPSCDRSGLGAFLPHFEDDIVERFGIDKADIRRMNNGEIFEKIAGCAQMPMPVHCWNGRYYYCIPRIGQKKFQIAEIGNLIEGIKAFNCPEIEGMHEEGSCKYLKRTFSKKYEETMKEELDLRFYGCSLCCRLIK